MLAPLIGLLVAIPCAVDATPPFPRVQVVPMPDRQFAFEIANAEVARYHYDASYHRPFVFPLIGPSGLRLTRLTHPHDPDGHGHHLSIWVAHEKVNGANFWVNGPARIVHQAVESIEDGTEHGSLTVRNAWISGEGLTLLDERRTLVLTPLDSGEYFLDIVIALAPAAGQVVLDSTPFGLLAVRVAKTMSVNDGDGAITNSEGGINEDGVFWKPARWMDYAGSVAPAVRNGIAFFDHPANPGHPVAWHVRNDGWMGACATKDAPLELAGGETRTFHYRLYIHDAGADAAAIEAHWRRWAENDE